jgi:hypothetical protein
VNTRDLAPVRAALCDDLVVEDHRRTGMGRIDGADEYLRAVAAIWEITSESMLQPLQFLAVAPRSRVFVNRTAGRNLEGGEFESVFVVLQAYRDERVSRLELFEPEDVRTALARFEVLCDDPRTTEA